MRLSRAWDRFWFGDLDPLSLGVFRIGLGLIVFFMYLALAPSWEAYFGSAGIPARWAPDPLSVFYWADGIVPVRALWWLGLSASVTFTLGFHARASTIVLYLLEVSMVRRDPVAINGEDLLMAMLLFYGCFAPMGGACSLDRRRRPEAGTPRAWPVRLMQVNVALIYVFSLPAKLTSDHAWWNGDFMYGILVSSIWSRWPWPKLLYHWWASAPMTYAAILTEGLFPLLVCFRKTRWIAVAAAASLHVVIALLIKNIAFFSLTMACSFLLFIPGEDLRGWARRVFARRGS